MESEEKKVNIPNYVVCPRCHADLIVVEGGARCVSCSSFYPRRATLYFADVVEDGEKARQQAIYDGRDPDALPWLIYRDLEPYRKYCTAITTLIQQRGLNGYQFKSLKTRQMLDRLDPRPGGHVLDIGSGDGSMLALLTLHYGAQGTGLDISSTVVERAVQVNFWGHEYYQGDAEQLPFRTATFDGVVSMDVLEHLPHPGRCIAEAARVLRPGGWALMYAVSQRDAYTWHWTQRQLTHNQVGVDFGAGHRWENFLQPEDARAWMRESGFDQVRITPFHALMTLLLDERLPMLFSALVNYPRLFRGFLKLAEWIDLPLTSRDFGNGFYLEGRKKT